MMNLDAYIVSTKDQEFHNDELIAIYKSKYVQARTALGAAMNDGASQVARVLATRMAHYADLLTNNGAAVPSLRMRMN